MHILISIRTQAVKLGFFFINSPQATVSLKPTGPTLILLIQIICIQMKTNTLSYLFHGGYKVVKMI